MEAIRSTASELLWCLSIVRPEQPISSHGEATKFRIRRLLAVGIGNKEAQYPGAKKPEGSQDHAEIVSGAAQDGIQGITESALEPIPTQLAFVFHMADRGLNGTAPMNGFLD